MTEKKSPQHVQEKPLDKVSLEYYLYVAMATIKLLKWEIHQTNETGFIALTLPSKNDQGEKITLKIENNSAKFTSESTDNQSIDWGKNRTNIENLIAKIEEQKYFFPFDEFEMKKEEQKLKLVSGKAKTTEDIFTIFFSIFKPTEDYFITPILINLNIALFIIKAIFDIYFNIPEVESLLNWGANFRPYTLEGEWWRLVASGFVHGGIVHLMMNMFALFYIGSLLEPYLGKAKFITAYLLAGLAASITSVWWNYFAISVGASGSIMGMFGVFLALLTTNITNKFKRKKLLESIIVFVFFNLIYGMKPGVDNAAHVGGLVCGIFIGYALIPGLRNPKAYKFQFWTIGLLVFLIVTSSFIIYKYLPNDKGKYIIKIEEFDTNEALALEAIKMPEGLAIEKQMYNIKYRGIYFWNKNIKLIDELDKLNLPTSTHLRNKKLKQYCQLRIKTYELIYQGIDEETGIYESEIERYQLQIDTVLYDLSDKINILTGTKIENDAELYNNKRPGW